MKTRNRKFAKVRTWMWILLISLGIRAESLDSLRQRQKTDQANLLEYYDNKALSDCPKLENGTINKASPEYKKISAEYQRAQEKLTIAYEKKYIRIQQSTGTDEENPSSAKEALISSTSAGIKDKGSRMEAEAQAEAEAKAEADARAKAKADAEAKAKAEKAMADAKAEAADAKAKAEATEARAKSEAAKAKAKAEMEAKAKSAAAEAKAKAQAAETQAKSDAKKAQAKAEAEQRAKSDAVNAKAEAEAASAKAKTEAADAAAKAEIQQKAKAEAQTAKARAEASKKQAKAEAEIKAKAEAAAAKAKAEAKALASSKADAEIKAKAEAAAAKADAKAEKAKANADAAEAKAQADAAEAKAKADAEAKAKTAAAEAKANADAAAAKAKTDADVAKAKADAEVKAKADRASAKAQADAAEAKAKAEMEAKANADAVEAQAKADAAEARAKANASEVKAKADAANAKAKVDAEVKAKSNLVEVKAKADTPEIKVDTPNAGKSAAGKILKTGGDILQGVDTFGAAEDAKQEFKKGNFGEGAIKIGESIADEATYGAYSGGKTIKEKHDDVKGSESDIERTNRNLRDQHDQNLRVELRKAGMSQDDVNKIRTTDGLEHALRRQGLEVPEAPTEISYVDKGEKGVEQLEQQLSEIHKNKMRDDLVKSGKMTQEEADKLKTEAGLEHAMKKNNLDLPEKPESGFIEVDDSWDERVEQVGEGVKNNVKKAGKFVKETGSDLAEIGTGLTEEGVADQVIENSKENVEGWLKKWEEERKSEAYTGDNKEGLEEYLIKRGASPVGAKNAADDFYEKGDTGKLENLDDTLRYKEAVAEAKKRGEEIPSKEEFDQVSNSLKARKERAAQEKEEQAKREAQADAEQKKQTAEGEDQKKLQQEEAEDAEPWSEEKDLANKRAALAEFTQRNLEKRRQETEGDFEGMEVTKEMDEASHAGDDDRRQAKTERNQAGEDARDIESESNRVVKEGDAENSWGKHIGDAIEDGLTTGFKTAGQEFGNAAADQVIDEIWEPEKPTPPQGPPAGGSSPAASGSGGNSAGGMISAESGLDAIPADAPLPEGGQIAANPDAMENEPGIVDEDGLENEPGFTEGDASGSGEDDDDGWLEGVVVSGANKAAENLGKQIDDAVEKTSTPTSSAAEKESSSSPGDYPAGMKPCIRCGAVKKIPKQESLCLSCVTKVMSSYNSYIRSGNGRGDEGYFQYLSSGTKAQIERNFNR